MHHLINVAGRIYNHCIALHKRYYCLFKKHLNRYALQKHLANCKQIVEENGDITVITDIYDDQHFMIIPEYEFLLAPISHIVKSSDTDQIRYSALSAVADKDFRSLDKRMLRFVISELAEKGVDIMVFKDSLGYRFEDYREKFWIK